MEMINLYSGANHLHREIERKIEEIEKDTERTIWR
jgi:hypothetical protein